jgi:hypothetical protein
MKFVARINLTKKKPEERIVTFFYNDPGPLPPIIDPENPEEAKDGGVPGSGRGLQKEKACAQKIGLKNPTSLS